MPPCIHFLPVDEAGLTERIFRAEEDVLRDVEVDDQGLFLIDHADAVVLGVHGGLRRIVAAAQCHRAGGLGLGADDDLQQGGFARAVLAHQAHDLAGVYRKVNAFERFCSGKGLGNIFRVKQIIFFFHSQTPPLLADNLGAASRRKDN